MYWCSCATGTHVRQLALQSAHANLNLGHDAIVLSLVDATAVDLGIEDPT